MASSSKMDEDPPEEDSDKDKKKKKEKKEKKDDGKKKGGKTKVKNEKKEKKEKKDDKPSDEKKVLPKEEKVLPKEEKDFDKFLKEDLHLEDEEEKKDKPASPVSRPYAVFFLISGHGFVHATSIRRLCASFAAIGRSELAIRRPRAAPTRHRIL